MNGLAFVALMLFLGCLLLLLSWVGWRFFLAALPVEQLPSVVPPAPDAGLPVSSKGGDQPHTWFRMFHWSLLAGLMVGGAMVGGVLLLSEWIVPDPLAALAMSRQAHIQSALNPERLLPPPPLPPSMFLSSDRPALETADRDWRRLNPVFTQSILQVLAHLEARGYLFALLEGYRSPERQEKLADQGVHVTNARAFQSKHQFGMAVDLAPVRDGRLVISERDPWALQAYQMLGEEVEKAGLVWGGRWWFKDYGHVELSGAVAAIARNGK